jgi:hypothetical protein
MESRNLYRVMFLVAAWYDAILGAVFFFFIGMVHSFLNIPVPETPVYYQAAAAFVFVQGIGYYFVYQNMERNIDIVKLGIVYKAIYTALALYYWIVGLLPHSLYGVFGLLDFIFLVLFVLYLTTVRGRGAAMA